MLILGYLWLGLRSQRFPRGMLRAATANLDVQKACVTKGAARALEKKCTALNYTFLSLLQPLVLAKDFNRLLTTPLRRESYPGGLVHQIIKVLLQLPYQYFSLSHNIF